MNATKNAILIWDDKYSITEEIDEQHKHLFGIINELIGVIDSLDTKEEDIIRITEDLLAFKTLHFATEEKYFHLFNYEGTAAHEAAHEVFNQKAREFQEGDRGNPRVFAYDLVDFLENWLIGHVMGMDQQYKQCFLAHGLK
ncbi:MAG TPA: bacteriohemerythrin [Candidatus Paceibacterota bacterium]|nr:bacteriohemerythrin [Candidatus Paceibacterota bacterium]